jgi:hypothetical protein
MEPLGASQAGSFNRATRGRTGFLFPSVARGPHNWVRRIGEKPSVVSSRGRAFAQARNNLSDEQVEYQVRDRLSFSRFLRLAIENSIPDASTLWLFRELGRGRADQKAV